MSEPHEMAIFCGVYHDDIQKHGRDQTYQIL